MEIVRNKWFRPGDKIFIPGDIHAPNHNKNALRIAMEAAAYFGCNKTLGLGDWLDSCHISRHGMTRESSFEQENVFMGQTTAELFNYGMDPTAFILGNHEDWYAQWSETNPGHTHKAELPDLYRHWDVLPNGSAIPINRRLVGCHGDGLNGSCATSPAASVLRNYPAQSFVFGHNHRLDVAYQTRWTGEGRKVYGAFSVGCLADLDFETRKKALRNNSQRHNLGFACVTLYKDDYFDVQLGHIFESRKTIRCLLAGKMHTSVLER